MHGGYGRDGGAGRPHALEEKVLGFVGTDYGPGSAVVDHLAVAFLGAGGGLGGEALIY